MQSDLEHTEYQKKVGSAFIYVFLYNGWDTDIKIFIGDSFEYELVFSNIRKTIKEKGKLPDSLIEILNSLIHYVNPKSFQSYEDSGFTDSGLFFIGYTTQFKQPTTTYKEERWWHRFKSLFMIGEQYKKQNYQEYEQVIDIGVTIANPIGSLESEDSNYNKDERILFQIKREFGKIFSNNIKKYHY